MKKILLITLLTLTIFVGVFPFYAHANTQPWRVRATVTYGKDSFIYDLQNYAHNGKSKVIYLGKQSRKKFYDYLQTLPLSEEEIFNYLLPGFDDVLSFFVHVHRQKRDAVVDFDGQGFHFLEGNDGVSINQKALFEKLICCYDCEIVSLPIVVDKATTVGQLQQSTVVRATFTTEFPNSTSERVCNVKLATQSINGTTVGVGEIFSFNRVVGKRTADRGYKNAKVILDGAYVDGVGGGVCQVSTTLYNALLLAGINANACQHSLISHYVLEGFDAMVSDTGADLTFVNDTNSPIYIQGFVQNKSVTFTIYGLPNEYQIVRESVKQVTPFDTVEIVDKQKYPQLIYADQTMVITNGSDGVKTQSYLKYYQNGYLIKTKLLRKNSYKKVDRVVARGYLQRSDQGVLPTL